MTDEYEQTVYDHKRVVKQYLDPVVMALAKRAWVHDDSKFSPEEREPFERMTPILKTLTYGSDEYKAALKELGPALTHHYQVNSHHPEHFVNGIDDMTLLDLIEMLCDWLAAIRRVKDGDIWQSLDINKERFHIGDQLYSILRNTLVGLKDEQP